jgi:hypothetical protein
LHGPPYDDVIKKDAKGRLWLKMLRILLYLALVMPHQYCCWQYGIDDSGYSFWGQRYPQVSGPPCDNVIEKIKI